MSTEFTVYKGSKDGKVLKEPRLRILRPFIVVRVLQALNVLEVLLVCPVSVMDTLHLGTREHRCLAGTQDSREQVNVLRG